MDSHSHIKAPLQTKLQTGQGILPSPPVPAPARGKDSSHHAPEFIFNPGPSDNRNRGRMKNLITGTSREVTWLPTTQVGAASLLLSAQIQAEISPVSSGQAAIPQLLSKAATHLSHLSLLLSCLPKAVLVSAGQALLQAGDHRVSPKEREVSTQLVHRVTVAAGQWHGHSGRCSGYRETKERISGFLSTS